MGRPAFDRVGTCRFHGPGGSKKLLMDGNAAATDNVAGACYFYTCPDRFC